MEYSCKTSTTITCTATATASTAAALKILESSTRHSASSSSTLISADSLSSRPPVILTPCAACKILRRRCVDKSCVLAPYFPPTEPLKFTIAHRVFGASNIIKLLQELPEGQRADAVNSMVYEANARLRDPIYGCAGAICQLQKQINELQAEVAKAQAEILNMQCQNASLSEQLICKKYDDLEENFRHELFPSVFDEAGQLAINVGSVAANWEPLWT